MEESDKTDKVSHSSDVSDDSGVLDCTEPKNGAPMRKLQPKSQLSHDVCFIVGDNKLKITAHKNILQNASSVFRDLLQAGDENTGEFDLPGIRAEAFSELLRHIYCADEQLNTNNVMSVLQAADYFKLSDLKQTCQAFLQKCLEVNNACKLLAEARLCECLPEDKLIISFIGENLKDVLQTKGIDCLSRSLLNEVLTLPGAEVKEIMMKQAADRWARSQCVEKRLDINDKNIMNSLHDCYYVDRDNSESHRYVMDSVTSRNLFEDQDDSGTKLSKAGGLSTVPSTASLRASPVPTSKRLSHMWPDLEKVTRLQEVGSSDINDGSHADAISFTVSHDMYLYGFGIYGATKQQEGKYKVDAILQQKKNAIVMETILIKGAGAILPVMLEKPIRIEKNSPYTLEIYINGPESYIGTRGLTQVESEHALFTFSNATKVKKNRTDISKGQIPRLYFLRQ